MMWTESNGNSGTAYYHDGPGLIGTLAEISRKDKELEQQKRQLDAERASAAARAKVDAAEREYYQKLRAFAERFASDLSSKYDQINGTEAWNEKSMAFRETLNKAIGDDLRQALRMMADLDEKMEIKLREIKLAKRKEILKAAKEAEENDGWLGKAKRLIGSKPADPDIPEKFKEVYAKAVNGDPRSQEFIGYLYDSSLVTKKDEALALYWTRKAANNGSVDAQLSIALDHCKYEEYPEAVPMLMNIVQNKSKDLNPKTLPLAQEKLADCLYNGWGIAQNQNEGIRLYELAAQAGELTAKIKLKDIQKNQKPGLFDDILEEGKTKTGAKK